MMEWKTGEGRVRGKRKVKWEEEIIIVTNDIVLSL